MTSPDLPFVDEHEVVVAAAPDRVWAALVATLDRAFSRPAATAYARLVGCRPVGASGPRPLTQGSTLPGFRVTIAVPGSRLVLEGRHRFSTYAMVVRLEPDGRGGTRLRAETDATFPGVAGGAYRALVIGSRGHLIGMRRLLEAVRRRAEASAD
ncbi:SRPBCC family protein [Nocardioides cynanchi]|uniref:SRPBCC family protein n=1 Tax=Nocardioides cynanchi TaxID=2558918 RepID=UPI0012476D2C|nr:SRPBCC family protein [Nocardioides cynanchi]